MEKFCGPIIKSSGCDSAVVNVGVVNISLGPLVFGSNESEVARTKTVGEVGLASNQVGGLMGMKPSVLGGNQTFPINDTNSQNPRSSKEPQENGFTKREVRPSVLGIFLSVSADDGLGIEKVESRVHPIAVIEGTELPESVSSDWIVERVKSLLSCGAVI